MHILQNSKGNVTKQGLVGRKLKSDSGFVAK